MTKSYLSVISYRTWDTESLEAFTKRLGYIVSCLLSLLDGDGCTCDISPASVFEADWLNGFYD